MSQRSKIRIVCLADQSPQNDRIIAALTREFDVPLVLSTEYVPRKKRRKLTAPQLIKKAMRRVYFSLRERHPRSALVESFLQPVDATEMERVNEKRVMVKSTEINQPATQEKIASYEPDYLFVSGAPILKKAIFGIPKNGALNLHFGISPDYRGQHTLFFPFLAGDFQKIGATLHFIDEGIDTGSIVASMHPEIHAGDSLEKIEARLTTLAAKVVVSAFHDTPLPQEYSPKNAHAGREIRHDDYGIIQDLQYLFRRKGGDPTQLLRAEEIRKP